MKYKRLERERKKAILEATIDQVESDHYSHELARQRAAASGKEAEVAGHEKIMADLEAEREALLKTYAEFSGKAKDAT